MKHSAPCLEQSKCLWQMVPLRDGHDSIYPSHRLFYSCDGDTSSLTIGFRSRPLEPGGTFVITLANRLGGK